jgi:glyoxylate reductase
MAAIERPKLLVTRKLPADVEARIAEHYEADINADDALPDSNELLEKATGKDALLVCPTDRLSAQVLGALPASVRIVSTFSVGYDHIDVPAATARGISVTNTPEVLTDATADIAMLLLLGAARGASWGERMVRNKEWAAWAPTTPLGVHVTGKRLGILGLGRIGRAVARRARAFDMEIHYYGRRQLSDDLAQGAVYHSDLESFLAACDFLSINCASTAETRDLINAETIAMLPDGAVLVNTSRGDIVDDDALIAALNSGKLAGAGLDVFKNEPDIDPRYPQMWNVFLLPHLGSATRETRSAMGHRAVDNLDAFFAGKTPGDIVTG